MRIGEEVKQNNEEEKAKKKQEFHDLVAYLKYAYQKAEQEKIDKAKAEKENLSQAIEKLKQTFDELRTKAQQAKEAKEQMRKEVGNYMRKIFRSNRRKNRKRYILQKIENLKSILSDLKTVLQKEATEREQKKQKHENAIKEKMVGYEKELLEATIEDRISENLQKSLDKAAIMEVIRGNRNDETTNNLTDIEPKGTILDEITGKSAWQTVTWILLGLCILLAIALIFMILYQVSHRKNYQRLDGQNKSPEDEGTPITQNVSPFGYVNEKNSGHPGPPVPASPSIPLGETQQF
uniref:Surface protein n=1 Tax=Heterorhabditis bacteriophora TaxID=37862 RepID=A0A1I7XCT1_HETBA